MPLQETSGAASYDAFGGGAAVANYIEEVFSTYLYTGNGSTQTITNGIDLDGEGGLVFVKSRINTGFPSWFDTVRGPLQRLQSSSTLQEGTVANSVSSFNTDGFSVGSALSASGENYVSWTFRKQPKFFDVVTYTGTGAQRTVNHNLESVPGCIMVKRTDTTSDWAVYHRSTGETQRLRLNSTDAASSTSIWASIAPTSTNFTVGSIFSDVNASGGTYVAYLFAHDAGGFGLTGTNNVISCGSYTGNGSATGPVITLGYEPQWLLVKNSSGTGDWNLIDNMRGFTVGGKDAELNPNLSNAESTGTFVTPTATGFQINTTDSGYNTNTSTYIYIAIRRGPMKVPTSGTEVFSPALGNGASGSFDTSFPVDFGAYQFKPGGDPGAYTSTRLLANGYMQTGSTNAEAQFGSTQPWDRMEDWYATADNRFIGWGFRRAPGFFDVVCYTGNGGSNTLSHNLGVTPQIAIVKSRSAASSVGWFVNVPLAGTNNVGYLNLTNSFANSGAMSMNSTSFSYTAGFADLNASATTYVAYLFATVAGVSKVGSYTGTGTTQVINCGFTAGARFVMIKRTDSTGNWYVWDSARGIVAGNDPYIRLDLAWAEITSTDYVDTAATGFEISSTAIAAINANGGTFIFLAIA